MVAEEEVRIRSNFGMKSKDATITGKPGVPGKQFVGDHYYEKSNKWNTKVQIIDRVNDWYFEEVRDGDTGALIHLCDEPLSEHDGHGSAKTVTRRTRRTERIRRTEETSIQWS